MSPDEEVRQAMAAFLDHLADFIRSPGRIVYVDEHGQEIEDFEWVPKADRPKSPMRLLLESIDRDLGIESY